LCFLFNSGARIQEALDVCPQAIHFACPPYVRLVGKGRSYEDLGNMRSSAPRTPVCRATAGFGHWHR
jgi:hypothetical protein